VATFTSLAAALVLHAQVGLHKLFLITTVESQYHLVRMLKGHRRLVINGSNRRHHSNLCRLST